MKRSKAEIALREPWSDTAVVIVEEEPGQILQYTWRLRAGAFDFSDYPSWRGINMVPGTERELRFTQDGCLLTYRHSGSRCPSGTAPAAGSWAPSEK